MARIPETPPGVQIVSDIIAQEAWIKGYLARCGARGADRDDLAQEVLRGATRTCGAFAVPLGSEPIEALRAWLRKIVKRVYRHHARREQARIAAERSSWIEPEFAPDPAEQLDTHRALEALRGATTPERWRVLVATVDGADMREVAQIEGIPINTGYTRFRLARRDLAAYLRRRAASDPER